MAEPAEQQEQAPGDVAVERGQPQGLPRHGRRSRQDLPDAAGGPGRGRGRAATSWSATSSRTAAKETVEQAGGSRVRARAAGFSYRDTVLEEMDLPAVIRRAPDLALIDELAHTNAPGLEHEKRYEDVEDVLDAGIDVYSTVNVQHLESLNDSVCELTGVRVRETMPDAVLNDADEVVLMDLTPEALLDRLRDGQDLPGRADRLGAQQLLPDREPGRAARGRPPPGGARRSSPSAWSRRPSGSARTGWSIARPPRRSASGCWR